MIEEFYRVTLDIDKYRELSIEDERSYEREMIEATKNSIESGVNRFSGVEEWATFSSYYEAQTAEKNMKRVINKYYGST